MNLDIIIYIGLGGGPISHIDLGLYQYLRGSINIYGYRSDCSNGGEGVFYSIWGNQWRLGPRHLYREAGESSESGRAWGYRRSLVIHAVLSAGPPLYLSAVLYQTNQPIRPRRRDSRVDPRSPLYIDGNSIRLYIIYRPFKLPVWIVGPI